MTLKYIFFAIAVVSASATLPKFKDAREIPPEQVGLYHTEAFDRLAEKYTSENPQNLHHVIRDMADIVSSYCIGRKCIRSVRRSALEKVQFGITHMKDAYPTGLDSTVKEHLESIETAVRSLDTHDVEEVVGGLTMLQDVLRETPDIDDQDKSLGLAAGSMAIESTKLWTSVESDPNHPLRAIRDVTMYSGNLFGRRYLQVYPNVGLEIELPSSSNNIGVILADTLALVIFLGFPIPAIFASLLASIFFQVPSVKPSKSSSSKPSSLPSSKPSSSPSKKPVGNQ